MLIQQLLQLVGRAPLELRQSGIPDTAPSNSGRLYYDKATDKIRMSENGGAYANVASLPGGVLAITDLNEQVLRTADVTVTSAQILALNATPKELVAAPGANKALIFEGAVFFYDYNSVAYAGIAVGEDLAVKYTNGAGLEVAQCEATGFLDLTADATRWVRPHHAASGDNAITPVANAALVLQMLVGEIITGNSPLLVRTYYRVVPTTLP